MSDSSDKGEKAEPEASNTPANEPAATSSEIPSAQAGQSTPTEGNLPVIWSPKLDAGEAMENENELPELDAQEAVPPRDESATEESNGGAAAAAPARSSRFALLAATIALAAALGSFLGSFSASGIAKL